MLLEITFQQIVNRKQYLCTVSDTHKNDSEHIQRYACTQTDTQTDRRVDHSTLHPYRGGVINHHTSSLRCLIVLVPKGLAVISSGAEVSTHIVTTSAPVRKCPKTLWHHIGTGAKLSWCRSVWYS